jgi:hypothetical protein
VTFRTEIAEILDRRANEVGGFLEDYRRDDKHYGSVEMALTRECERLRLLAHLIREQGDIDA